MIGKATQFRSDANGEGTAREAGKKSGKRRRFAKSFVEATMANLEKKVLNKSTGEMVNGFEAASNMLMSMAMKGNIQAMRLLIELVGELNKAQKLEISGNVETTERKSLSVAEARKIVSELKSEYGVKE